MPRPISLIISPQAMRHNLASVKQIAQQNYAQDGRECPHFWAVIKANAYGHGVPVAVEAFAEADGLAMLDLSEALLCRQYGWTKPIMLLEGYFSVADAEFAAEHDLTVVIHTFQQLAWLKQATLRRPLAVLMKLNTGMNRLGFSADDYPIAFEQAQQLQKAGQIHALGVMTHFARADDHPEATVSQVQRFSEQAAPLSAWQSICNSAGTLSAEIVPLLPHSTQQWVRPGICLYGSSPFTTPTAQQLGLRPAQTLTAELISIRTVQAGEGIGYGYSFVANNTMRIGVVACGYADGYPRHAPSGTPIYVEGVRTQLVGRVSMDMLMVDLSHLPHADVGSNVVLWGKNGPSVDEVAQAAGTIGYELLCAVTPRVPRLIQKEGHEE